MTGLILVLMFLSPLFVMLLFDWIMKRKTGYHARGQLGKPLFRRDDIDFLNLPKFDEAEQKRKTKATPRYDAFLAAEQQAERLSLEAVEDEESLDNQNLADLLSKKEKSNGFLD